MDIGIQMLRLVPLVLIFYVPALLAVATWSERGEGYKAKAAMWIALSCTLVVLVQLLIRDASLPQIAAMFGISIAQFAVALLLAVFTVYKLAD